MQKLLLFLLIFMIFVVYANEAGKKVAVVSMVRGDVFVIGIDGSSARVEKGDWLVEGAKVKTEDKSFAKLSFIDRSTMNVGPSSEMVIEKFSNNEAGVINVISGKIRSQVTKDYLDMDKEKSKLFVKSQSAVMGVRGTDFTFSTNKKTGTSTAVLFEGKVVFNKINKGDNLRDLEKIVNKGRKLVPGQFSIVNPNLAKPTVPAKLNSKQIRSLKKNESFLEASKQTSKRNSVVPSGLTESVVTSDDSSLNNGLSKVVDLKVDEATSVKVTQESKGYIKGSDAKPIDGAMVHLESGVIIPQGSDSTFDENSGEWVSTSSGSVNAKGEYVPPEGYKITETGEILKTVDGQVVEINAPIVPTAEDAPLNKLEIKISRMPASFNETKPEPEMEILPPPPRPECGVACKGVIQTTPPELILTPRAPTKTKVEINVR